MTLAAVKEKLHSYIEHADSKKLQAIYTLLEDEINTSNYNYDDKTLKMLEERSNNYEKGLTKGYTVDQSMKRIKKAIKKRAL